MCSMTHTKKIIQNYKNYLYCSLFRENLNYCITGFRGAEKATQFLQYFNPLLHLILFLLPLKSEVATICLLF